MNVVSGMGASLLFAFSFLLSFLLLSQNAFSLTNLGLVHCIIKLHGFCMFCIFRIFVHVDLIVLRDFISKITGILEVINKISKFSDYEKLSKLELF